MNLSSFPGRYFLLLPRRTSTICKVRLVKTSERSCSSLQSFVTPNWRGISMTILLFMMIMQLIPEKTKRNYQINRQDLNTNLSLENGRVESARNRIHHPQSPEPFTYLNHTILLCSFLVHIVHSTPNGPFQF